MNKIIKLKLQKSLVVRPNKPFAFDPTFHKPAHFPSGDNYWEPGARWQTFRFLEKDLGVVFKNVGSVDKPKIEVKIYAAERLPKDFIEEFIKEIKYRYSLDLNLNDFYKHFSDDKIVGPVIKKIRGMRPGHQDSLYEYLIIGIVLQNCTVRRSVQMMQVLFEKYGTRLEFAGKKLWCFWEPGNLMNVTDDELRALKLG